MDAIESCERPYGELHAIRNLAWGADVDLRNLVGGNGTLVFDVHLHVETTGATDNGTQSAIGSETLLTELTLSLLQVLSVF